MKRHIAYLRYVIRHKWFVFQERRYFRVNLWQSISHDLSKFLPSEWFSYASTFYNTDGTKRYNESIEFSQAWNKHQKRNPHHWQYWLITWDRGITEPLPIPEKYVREMLADWAGAGRAITGKREIKEWYIKNQTKIILHKDTRAMVEGLLG